MKLTLNKTSALFVLRAIRAGKAGFTRLRRSALLSPDPSPGRHWSKKLFDLSNLKWNGPLPTFPLDVAVAAQSERIGSKYAQNTIYESAAALPPRSFVEVKPGLVISCPELLFVELAESMELAEHLMLGFELCGGFSRDPVDPLNGPVAFGVQPATSVARIREYVETLRWIPGVARARRTLEFLADNAWSPTEAVVATMASLPLVEFGYELGPCVLNERVYASGALKDANAKESRVPDILFGDTAVGINYDGAVHLDLDSIVGAAVEVGQNPGVKAHERALEGVVREVRAKVVDDIRRNRELAAAGYTVFPVVKEDLYEEGGLDRVMWQIIATLEKHSGKNLSLQHRLLGQGFIRQRRQELLWSLLPGSHPDTVSAWNRGIVVYDEPRLIGEMTIGF